MLFKEVIQCGFMLLTILFMLARASSADVPDGNEKDNVNSKQWIGCMHGSLGQPYHIWSAKTYEGYKNTSFGIFWEWETPALIPLSSLLDQTLRIELRYLRMWGTIELKDDQVPQEEYLQGGPFYTTLDHQRFAVTMVRKWIVFPDYPIRPSAHLGFGMSWTDKKILEEGTYYHFDFVGGLGVEFDITNKLLGNLGARWEHFSNGGAIYLTDKHVIGPESVNLLITIAYEI